MRKLTLLLHPANLLSSLNAVLTLLFLLLERYVRRIVFGELQVGGSSSR